MSDAPKQAPGAGQADAAGVPVSSQADQERRLLMDAQSQGLGARLLVYTRLSGPGWLQSAITLGGGSLASSLYLGVLAGFALLWLQPLAMILGIIMLSAIGYVTMSTGERPFRAINDHVNPVLGWSWIIATLMANMVWAMPQFSLANSVIQQNLAPGTLGEASALGDTGGKIVISAAILVITVLITWSYGSGHWGIKLYELMLKLMVATIVLSFFLVVLAMTRAGQLDWGAIFAGFIPNPQRIFQPAEGFHQWLNQLQDDGARAYWSQLIVHEQRDRLVAAAATAVGINMTFLFPYSILRKGWTKEYRGLQKFDLATGMFIPFVIATSCVVIASAQQFHLQPVPGLVDQAYGEDGALLEATPRERNEYRSKMTARLQAMLGADAVERLQAEAVAAELGRRAVELPEGIDGSQLEASLRTRLGEDEVQQLKDDAAHAALDQRIEQLPDAEQMLGAMLVSRDANQLARSLRPLTESDLSNWLFGVGVVGMTLSTITILMLISGFALCEIFNLRADGWTFRLACLPAAVGVLGPFIWGRAGFALAIPTSVFGFMLLPIAYLTFFLLMNQRSLLGAEMPRGGRRVAWNVLMATAASVATVASIYMVWVNAGLWGIGGIGALLALTLAVQLHRWSKPWTY